MVLTGADVRSWWLVRLRWGGVAGHVIIILVASRFPRVDVPVGTLLSLTAAMAATNAALHGWLLRGRGGISTAWAGSILAFDVAQLTGLL